MKYSAIFQAAEGSMVDAELHINQKGAYGTNYVFIRSTIEPVNRPLLWFLKIDQPKPDHKLTINVAIKT